VEVLRIATLLALLTMTASYAIVGAFTNAIVCYKTE